MRRKHSSSARGAGPRRGGACYPSRMLESTMRVAEYDRFGGPEVLVVRAKPVLRPSPGQVLVRVKAAALNPKDLVLRAGRLPHRLIVGSSFPKRLGYDWAGEVVALGRGAREYREGDAL